MKKIKHLLFYIFLYGVTLNGESFSAELKSYNKKSGDEFSAHAINPSLWSFVHIDLSHDELSQLEGTYESIDDVGSVHFGILTIQQGMAIWKDTSGDARDCKSKYSPVNKEYSYGFPFQTPPLNNPGKYWTMTIKVEKNDCDADERYLQLSYSQNSRGVVKLIVYGQLGSPIIWANFRKENFINIFDQMKD